MKNIIVTKNLNDKDQNIILPRHNLIKYANSQININNLTFKNQIYYIENNVILPNVIRNISCGEYSNLTL